MFQNWNIVSLAVLKNMPLVILSIYYHESLMFVRRFLSLDLEVIQVWFAKWTIMNI